MRRGLRLATVSQQLHRLESRLAVRETPQHAYDRAIFTRWLAESEDGAILALDYADALEEAGGYPALLASAEGRQLMLAIAESLYQLVVPDGIHSVK